MYGCCKSTDRRSPAEIRDGTLEFVECHLIYDYTYSAADAAAALAAKLTFRFGNRKFSLWRYFNNFKDGLIEEAVKIKMCA